MRAGLDDLLARALWEAWCNHRVVDLPDLAWAGLTVDRATAIANELYVRLADTPSGAWKLGGLDPKTRTLAGLSAPLVAPVPSTGLSVGVSEMTLSLASFVQPRLEAEVGVAIRDSGMRLVPCVEVADCRFPEWRVPLAAGLADFGLQGAMMFGPDYAPVDEVHVSVRHDGRRVGSGQLAWSEAVSRLGLVPSRQDAPPVYVATGAITAQFDARPGRWEFEFRGLTTLSLTLS